MSTRANHPIIRFRNVTAAEADGRNVHLNLGVYIIRHEASLYIHRGAIKRR